jgi:hypothetical protein
MRRLLILRRALCAVALASVAGVHGGSVKAGDCWQQIIIGACPASSPIGPLYCACLRSSQGADWCEPAGGCDENALWCVGGPPTCC